MTINLVSTSNSDRHNYSPFISPDGRYVAFTSEIYYDSVEDEQITSLFVKDLTNDSIRQIPNSSSSSSSWNNDYDSGRYVEFSADSRHLTFRSRRRTENRFIVYEDFVHDLAEGQTELFDPLKHNFDFVDSRSTTSSNGRYRVFESEDNDLVEDDLNIQQDIFLEDLVDNTIRIVSVDNYGVSAYGTHRKPFISSNGRYVFFVSDADNLVEDDSNKSENLFVRDLVEGTTERINIKIEDSERYANGKNFVLSEDNRYIVYQSETQITANDTDEYIDVYLQDLGESFANSATEEVILPDPDDRSNEPITKQIPYYSEYRSSETESQNPLISDDGNVVFFELVGQESRYEGIYTSSISQDDYSSYYYFNRSPSAEPFGYSHPREIIKSGKNIDLGSNGSLVFASRADNLVVGDTGDFTDIFIRTNEGSVTRVSVDNEGFQANSNSNNPHLSHDGNYVAFTSYADNLVPDDDNGFQNIFVRNLLNETTQIVNIASDGTQANKDSYEPLVSNNGRYVVFSSYADNLVPNDNNGVKDIFVRDLVEGTTELVSVSDDGSQFYFSDPNYLDYDLSPDGRYVAFIAPHPYYFENGDLYYDEGIYIRDLKNKTTRGLDIKFTETVSDYSWLSYSIDNLRISDGGRYVFFESGSNYLVEEDTDNANDIFVRDLFTNTTELISAPNNIYNLSQDYIYGQRGDSYDYDISPNGRYVAFYSDEHDLVNGDNGGKDLFIRDRGESSSLNEEYYVPINPKIEITSIEQDEVSNSVTINYNATDEDSEAKISLHYDNDNSVDNGFETITDTLIEKDGAGSFVWNIDPEIPTGDYYLFATVSDNNSDYTSDYFARTIEIKANDDLSVIPDPISDPIIDENEDLDVEIVEPIVDESEDIDVGIIDPNIDPIVDETQSNFSLADVHRFYQYEKGFHLYTADPNEIDSIKQRSLNGELSYNYEAERYKVLTNNRDLFTGETIEEAKPIYRFFNTETGAHLYTMNENEKSYIQENFANYSFEGIKYYAFEAAPSFTETIPVYRMLNTQSGAHLFTSDINEINYIQENLSHFSLENGGEAAFHVMEL